MGSKEDFELIYAVICIGAAFILYTIGVWSEKVQGELKRWHVIIFWFGVLNDSMGTLIMEDSVRKAASVVNTNQMNNAAFHMNFHSITGMLALTLMLFHVGWATAVLIKNNTRMVNKFHQFSLFVWSIWLIPFITGAIAHML